MAVNQATLDLIVRSEGLRTEAYPDPAHGWGVPTIGVGHTSAAGPPNVYMGLRITREEAYSILARDLEKVEAQVRKLVKVPLNDNQFGALVSFTFNLGVGNFGNSTLLRLLNRGDYKAAAGEFKRWTRAGGKILPGLVRRRAAEAALFLTPAATPADTPKPRPAGPIAAILAAVGALVIAFLKSKGLI